VVRYKIHLSIGRNCFSFVHADRYVNEGKWTRFYRGDSVVAEYATVSLLKVEEIRRLDETPTTKGGRKRL
jgi:hypothetical protein